MNVDSDRLHRWDLNVSLVHVLGLHLKGRQAIVRMAVLGQRVGAVAHEGVMMAVEGVVEGAHDPAGARGGWCWSSSAKPCKKSQMSCHC